jgi:hypothetical protein
MDCQQLAALKLVSLRFETPLEVNLNSVRQFHSAFEHGCTAVDLHEGRTAGCGSFLWKEGMKGLKFTKIYLL